MKKASPAEAGEAKDPYRWDRTQSGLPCTPARVLAL